MPMFLALLSWQNHCESSPGSLYKIELRQAADDPQTKPNNLECESACRLPESTPTITIYYYQLSVISYKIYSARANFVIKRNRKYYYSARKLILILPSRGG